MEGFFEGWESSQWALTQQRHYSSWDLWAHRNGILHQHNNALLKADQAQLEHEIRKAYFDLQQLASQKCKFLLSLTLHCLLGKDDRYKATWLKQAVAALRHHRQDNGRSLFFMRKHFLLAWLQPNSSYCRTQSGLLLLHSLITSFLALNVLVLVVTC